ncbi:putative fad binding domain protein [Eutypa lata UCREL1]|uniref:Putative fad binding domain protein n=1 Tax=Eutypa lata (strain UCR-EL1) TaxID=1287681 RepID=M7TLR9_EUTLA|nr:putative fad binding domain protein [Eutypa lata UCREL1]
MPANTEQAIFADDSLGAQRGSDGDATEDETRLAVAIVGGGIVGIILALGLVERGVRVAVYERASDFHEIGAGFAFTGVAQECMKQLGPAVIASLRKVANENLHATDNYWDGYHQSDDDEDAASSTPASDEKTLLFRMSSAKMAWWSCLRSHFLDELAKALPPGIVRFNKELVSYDDSNDSNKPVTLRFADETTAKCEVLIGCDGIRSRVRQQLLSTIDPQATRPSYTHKTCYRAVVPMAAAESALGPTKPHNHCMHQGPGAHILSYPVAQHTLLNVVLFITDDGPWSGSGEEKEEDDGDVAVSRMTRPGRREDVVSRLEGWRPEVRALVALIPEAPMTWGIFDTAEHPAPWYAQGRVCLAGDAAHASSPHHGAGAGFGIEDALALATGLGMAADAPVAGRKQAVVAALSAFNDVRYERTQWLVRSSRETGDIYEWMYPGSGSDPVKLQAEIAARQKKIWDFDVTGMVEETRRRYHARLEGHNSPE